MAQNVNGSPIDVLAVYTIVNEQVRVNSSLIPSFLGSYEFVRETSTGRYLLKITTQNLESDRVLVKINHETNYTTSVDISGNFISVYFRNGSASVWNSGEWSIEILRLL